jgi:hypothetical protein
VKENEIRRKIRNNLQPKNSEDLGKHYEGTAEDDVRGEAGRSGAKS